MSLFKLVVLLLLCCAFVLLLFVNLSGATFGLPSLYWSQVHGETSITRWYSYTICKLPFAGPVVSCSPRESMTPFSPVDTWSVQRIPLDFSVHRSFYYTATRYAFVALVLAITFDFMAIILLILDLLGSVVNRLITIAMMGLSLVFVASGAACNTAAHYKGVGLWRSVGYDAEVGVAMMGLIWASTGFIVLGIAVSTRAWTAPPAKAE
ncbi:hypothetical protein DICA0_E36202 [Diutina catenulata]